MLRLLGPLDLVVDGRTANLNGPRGRIVLAMLALNAGRMTPVEQLIDAVWGASPPPTARGQIQTSISWLRKLLDGIGLPGVVETCPPGYVLRIPEDSIDTGQFGLLVAKAMADENAGRPTEAAIALRAALALWRGPALADIRSDLVQRAALLLEDRRLAAAEARLRLELVLSRHREVCGEIQQLVAEHPLREDLYQLLMLALYRSGRQADALEIARRARATLVEELGLEPGTGLSNLERAILNHDPALDLPAATPPPSVPPLAQARMAAAGSGEAAADVAEPRLIPQRLPASTSDFTNQKRQISEITRWLSGESGQAPYAVPIVAIFGQGGAGKSALAVRAAHELAGRFPDGQLYARYDMADDGRKPADILDRFIHALGISGHATPSTLEDRAELYRSKLAAKRMLVVLDDVISEEQVLPLLPGSPTCAVITTCRSRLSGLPGAHWVHLDVFAVEDSLALLSKLIGSERVDAERDAALELVRLCGGLPLALRIAGARLAARPHWQIQTLVKRLTGGTSKLDEFAHQQLDLRSTIALSYRGLDERARRLFRLFALVEAPDSPGWTAAALLDTTLTEAEDVLEGLVDAQLLNVISYPGAQAPHYGFHELVQPYAREQLMTSETDAGRREALGRLLGGWLALAGDAHARQYGGDYAILHGTAARWRPPDRHAADLLGDPGDWWENERAALIAAIRQAAGAGMDELSWDLALTALDLFQVKGYFDDWRETSRLALEVAERAGNRTGHAAMLYSLGTLHMFQKDPAEARRCFTAARELFAADGNTHGCALVLRNWALVDRLQGDAQGQLAKSTDALSKMRAVGDRIGEAHVLSQLAKFWIDEDEFQTAEHMLCQALAICEEVPCARVEAQVRYRFAELYLGTGRFTLARGALNQALLLVRDIGDRIGEAYTLYGLGALQQQEGRLDAAETTLRHALALAGRVGEHMAEGQALYTLGEIALIKGDMAAARRHCAAARGIFEDLSSTLWLAKTLLASAEVHAIDGETAASLEDIRQADVLLSGVSSQEAKRWMARLEGQKATLLSGVRSRRP